MSLTNTIKKHETPNNTFNKKYAILKIKKCKILFIEINEDLNQRKKHAIFMVWKSNHEDVSYSQIGL